MAMHTTAVLEVLHAHRSVRSYRSDGVPEDVLMKVLAAAQRTATSSNLQMASVVVVEDGQRKARLAELCGDQKHIHEAPLFLAWCADRHRLARVCQLQGYEQNTEYLEAFLVASVEAALMMQSATVAAEALGLGACYIGALRNNAREVVQLLELPPGVFPVAGMTVGYPAVAAADLPPRRPRLPLSSLMHRERYEGVDDADLREYDREMRNTGIYTGRQMAGPPMDEDQYGWLEHSARRVKDAQRKGLRAVAEQQGFLLR